MSDSVKMVFKALLCTIFFMVMTSVCIELFNVNITGMQVRQMSKMAARQAAELFTQESYKIDDGAGTVRADDVTNIDGGVYISGDFYGGRTDMYDIYDSIYGVGSQFDKWCDGTEGSSFPVSSGTPDEATYKITKLPRLTKKSRPNLLETYTNLQAMKIGVDQAYESYLNDSSHMPSWDDDQNSKKVKDWDLYNRGQAYYQLCYTPINLGIPYLDSKIMNKMFRWNLARLTSNCDPDLIQTEEDHNYIDLYSDPNLNETKYFVNYKGFKIHADQARISSYEYYVFNLADGTDKAAYERLTNNKVVDADTGGAGIKVNKHIDVDEEFEEEDNFVSVVSITYEVPIEYIGITPIRTIFNYIWGKEVAGIKGTGGNPIEDTNGIHEQWNNKSQSLTSGNTSNYIDIQNDASELQDSLFTKGYLTYSIVN